MKTNAKLMTGLLLMGSLITPRIHAQTAPTPPASAPDAAAPAPPIELRADRGHRGDRPGGPFRDFRHSSDRRDGLQEPRPPREPRGPHNRGGLTALTTLTGTVGELKGNDDFILDGFTLKTAAGSTTLVKFPAHLGQSVQQAVKAGNSVSVSGISDTGRGGETIFRMTSLTAGKTTILDAPPILPSTPPSAPVASTLTGKIADYQLDREGRVNGFTLTGSGDAKTIVRIPAHVAYQLTNLATKGSTITVQGYPKILREGQVQLEKVNILRPTILTINGQQYLIR
ncbi:hypothetical protein [Larkinella rosea]|uniref:DUF5666 domain-containing protein n=1 Tax=Larkinella rosea TaxID=2025312 RepID=A0A3P1C0C6_9BACT|nr:hypothetical protein [Larkinella rosea]RRB06722.1 hypothetical protein EHT25_02700 [Larkinella rosea]